MAIEAVLKRFDIADGQARRLPRGEVNDLWRIQSSRGWFVLKRTHIERYPEHTRREHRVLLHLCCAGWSVPSPVQSDDGDTVVRIDGRTWWLAPWLRGRQPLVTPAGTRRLGAVLARLHLSLAELADEPPLEGEFAARAVRSRSVARHGWTFTDGLRDLEQAEPALGKRLHALSIASRRRLLMQWRDPR